MEVNVTKKDIRVIANYVENGGLIDHMNKAGLSFGAMAVVLTAIGKECNRILEEMNKEEENAG